LNNILLSTKVYWTIVCKKGKCRKKNHYGTKKTPTETISRAGASFGAKFAFSTTIDFLVTEGFAAPALCAGLLLLQFVVTADGRLVIGFVHFKISLSSIENQIVKFEDMPKT
jgi:hypothetical protein